MNLSNKKKLLQQVKAANKEHMERERAHAYGCFPPTHTLLHGKNLGPGTTMARVL